MSWCVEPPPKAQRLPLPVPDACLGLGEGDLPPGGLQPVPGADTYSMASSVCDCRFVF